MDIEKQIANLLKQNDGMETSFKNKGIAFNQLTMDSSMNSETMLGLLKEYNDYLKTISKNNRAPPPPPVQKPKAEVPSNQEQKKKKEKSEEDDDDDDVVKEVKPAYSTVTNMEDIKRAFFSKEYDTFHELVRQHAFKYYSVNYKYSSDNNGRPAYVAKNLLRGFVQGLDDYRKYLMVCFRCILSDPNTNEYTYPSYWIVNSNDNIAEILGSLYDDYEFSPVIEESDIHTLLHKMEKSENESDDTLIGEVYLH